MIFVWLIAILMIVFIILVIPILVKEFKHDPNSSAKEQGAIEAFARFPFTDEEWEYVNQKEFVEDEKGKKFLDRYSNIISYGKMTQENDQREIIFTPQQIYLTDGKKGKSFNVNRLNSVGNGFKLSSIDLLHLLPLNKLRIKIEVVGVNPDFGNLDYSLEYSVPVPQASLEQINEILKSYGEIIMKN